VVRHVCKKLDCHIWGMVSKSLPTPSGVTEADVLKAFPGAESATLHKNKQGEPNGWATVVLRTVAAAAAAAGGAEWHGGIFVPRMGFLMIRVSFHLCVCVFFMSLPPTILWHIFVRCFSCPKSQRNVFARTPSCRRPASPGAGVEVEVKGAKVTPFADGKRPPGV